VTVTLRWDRSDFAGGDLRQAGHCIVTLDGRPRLELSSLEAPSANDGEYRGSFVMPADLAPGDCLCILGVASGDAPEGGPVRLGGNSCLTVTEGAPPVPTTTPVTSPAASPATTNPPAPPPATVLGATETRPSEPGLSLATQTAPQPLAELPRTGSNDVRLLLALGGLALCLGGGAITTRR
jgi:LPXTG-motif cell wall-anchored protein